MSDETTTEEVTDTETPAPEAPDFSEQFTALNEKLDRAIEANRQPVAQALTPEYEEEYADEDAMYEQPQYADPELAQEVQQIRQELSDRETRERRDALDAIAEKYGDDFTDEDNLRAITDRIKPLAERYNDPTLFTNPQLVEQAYLSMKYQSEAEAEDKAPAEEAARRGATLETDASSGGPTDRSAEDEFIENFGKGREKANAFT